MLLEHPDTDAAELVQALTVYGSNALILAARSGSAKSVEITLAAHNPAAQVGRGVPPGSSQGRSSRRK